MVGTAIFTFLFKTFVLMHWENWTVCFIFLILLYLIYMFTSKIVPFSLVRSFFSIVSFSIEEHSEHMTVLFVQ